MAPVWRGRGPSYFEGFGVAIYAVRLPPCNVESPLVARYPRRRVWRISPGCAPASWRRVDDVIVEGNSSGALRAPTVHGPVRH